MNPLSPPTTIGLALIGTLLLGGCASTEARPNQSLNAARAAITEAEAAGARDTAPVLLNQARSKVADARGLIGEENYAEARRKLEQATADARLARAQAHTAEARRAADELNETIDMLRKRMLEEQS